MVIYKYYFINFILLLLLLLFYQYYYVYILDIVNNSRSGLDVDKLDYFQVNSNF